MRVIEKPWGREVWWAVTECYVGKVLEIRAGHSLSLQFHREKLESMYFLGGEGILRLGDETIRIEPGKAITIRPRTVHRITAESALTLIEVSTPQVEDVVRLSDEYGRTGIGEMPKT